MIPHPYISWTPPVYDSKEIIQIHNKIQKTHVGMEPPNAAGEGRKKADVQLVIFEDIKKDISKIINHAYQKSSLYFGYHINFANDIDVLHYNTYTDDKKSRYDFHTDSGNNPMHDIKLTLLVNLSPREYEGGEFFIFDNGQEQLIEEFQTPGTAVMLKSHINHKVTPVTKGVRRTLTHFMKGPAWT